MQAGNRSQCCRAARREAGAGTPFGQARVTRGSRESTGERKAEIAYKASFTPEQACTMDRGGCGNSVRLTLRPEALWPI